ncbi:MAG: superoxide dismutase [Ni] [Candidatus Anammoxibacter sp.]
MKRFLVFNIIFVLIIACVSCKVWAHCEIPCGIYSDDARFAGLAEDINTIEKSMNKIIELSKDPKVNINQLVRWVQNKEEHADKINEVVTKYFLKQRVKPVTKSNKGEYTDYTNKLALLHQIMINSMKAKQTTNLEYVEHLSALVNEFHKAYHPNEFKNQ